MRKNHLDQKFSIYTTDENKKKLLDMARREDRSLAYIINKIITEYFEIQEKGLVSYSNPFEDVSYPSKRKEREATKELQEQVFKIDSIDDVEEF